MGYTWLGMRKLTWEEVLQRHEKGELAGCFRLILSILVDTFSSRILNPMLLPSGKRNIVVF